MVAVDVVGGDRSPDELEGDPRLEHPPGKVPVRRLVDQVAVGVVEEGRQAGVVDRGLEAEVA